MLCNAGDYDCKRKDFARVSRHHWGNKIKICWGKQSTNRKSGKKDNTIHKYQ